MQAQAFSWLLLERTTTDGQSVCFVGSRSSGIEVIDVRCKGDNGNILFSVLYTKVTHHGVSGYWVRVKGGDI